MGLRDLFEHERQVQALERGHMGTDASGDEADQSALAKDVDAEAVFLADLVGEVEGSVLREKLALGGAHDLEDEFFDPIGGEGLPGRVLEDALETQLRRLADLQVDVIGECLDRDSKELVDLRFVIEWVVGIQRLVRCHRAACSIGREPRPRRGGCRRAGAAVSPTLVLR